MATAPLDIEQAVREAAEQRRAKLTPPPTKAAMPSFVPKDMAPIISSAAERHGVPADELALIARQESNFNPRAVNRESGAEGMFQQHPPAHPNYRLGTGDPAYQTDYAAARYRELLNRYGGDREKATTAWYGGQGTIDRAIARNPEAWQLALPPRTGKYNADTNNLRASLGALSPVQQAQAQPNPAVIRTYGAKPYEPPAEQPRPARALTPPPMDPAAAAELRTEVDRAAWNRKNILEKGASLIARPLYRGWQQAGQTSNVVTSELGLESPEEAAADIVARTQNLREAGTPFYAEEARKRAEGKGVAGSLAEMLRDPRAAVDVSLESLTQSIASLIAGAAAGFGAGLAGAGPIGAAVGTGAGAGLGSFAVDYGSEILGAMQEAGVDLTDAESVQAALEDPELMHKARVGAVAHGLPVAAFDALSAGMASKLIRPTTALLGKKVILETGEQVTKATAVSNLAAGIAELTQQTVFGGTGEALGQIAKSGEIYDPYGVAAEVVGEIPSGAIETATGLGRDYIVRQKGLPPPPAGPAQAATEAAVGAGAVQPPPEGGPPGGPPPAAAPEATGPQPKPGPVPAGVLYGEEPPEAGAAPPPPPSGAPPSNYPLTDEAGRRYRQVPSGGVSADDRTVINPVTGEIREYEPQEPSRVEQPTVQPVPIQPVGLAQAEGQPAEPAGPVKASRPAAALTEPTAGTAKPAAAPSVDLPRIQVGPKPDGVGNLMAQQARDLADRNAITPVIEELAAQGLTASQIVARLKDEGRLEQIPQEEWSNLVVGTRATLGIPSQATAEGKAEFQTWLNARNQRKMTAALTPPLTPPPSQEKPSEEAQPAPVAGLPAEEARPEAGSVQGSAEPAPAAGNAPQDAAQAQGLRPVFNGKVETQRGNKIAAPPRRDTPKGTREYNSWLLKAARKEAQGANDQIALDAFHGIKPNKMTDADFSDLSNYLFGEEDVEFDLGGPRAPRKAKRAPRKAKRAPERGDERGDSILQFLAKTRGAGRARRGLDLDEAILQGLDPHRLGSVYGHQFYRAFHKGGMSFDHAAELLHEAGYPVTSRNAEGQVTYDPNVLLDKISQELAGNKVYSYNRVMPEPQPEPEPLLPEDYENAGVPLPTESEAASEPQEVSLVQQAINIDYDATEKILNEVGDDPADIAEALTAFIRARTTTAEIGEVPELQEGPGSTEEPDWGITDEPAAPVTPTYEPAGAGQQAVIPGAEQVVAGPTEAEKERELIKQTPQALHLTPPAPPPMTQTGLGLAPPAPTPKPTPATAPPPSIGGGLFAQPATPKVDEAAGQGALDALLAAKPKEAPAPEPTAPAAQPTATAAEAPNDYLKPAERAELAALKKEVDRANSDSTMKWETAQKIYDAYNERQLALLSVAAERRKKAEAKAAPAAPAEKPAERMTIQQWEEGRSALQDKIFPLDVERTNIRNKRYNGELTPADTKRLKELNKQLKALGEQFDEHDKRFLKQSIDEFPFKAGQIVRDVRHDSFAIVERGPNENGTWIVNYGHGGNYPSVHHVSEEFELADAADVPEEISDRLTRAYQHAERVRGQAETQHADAGDIFRGHKNPDQLLVAIEDFRGGYNDKVKVADIRTGKTSEVKRDYLHAAPGVERLWRDRADSIAAGDLIEPLPEQPTRRIALTDEVPALERDMRETARKPMQEWFKDETKGRDLRRIREAMEIYERLHERGEEADTAAATAILRAINTFFENQTPKNAAQFDDAVWSGLQQLTGEENPDDAALLENEVFASATDAGNLIFDTVDPQTASFNAEELNTAFGMVEFRRPVASTFPTQPESARVDHAGYVRNGVAYGIAAGPFVTPEEAVKTIDGWKAHALSIGAEKKHGQQVIVSLFDRTGMWAQPWKDAGFKVITADVQTGQDLMNFGQWMGELEDLIADGYEISGVLAAPPCTSFSVAGNRWWKEQHATADPDMVAQKYGEWARDHFERPLDYARTLVAVVKLFVAQANPRFYAMENPIGRINAENNLPLSLLTFNPHAYGDPYTKITGLWGEFNPNLPLNNIKPTEGSRIHKLRGDDPEQKLMRSETPLGFAYAFFEANYPAVAEMMPEGETFTPPIGTFSPVMEGEAAAPESETVEIPAGRKTKATHTVPRYWYHDTMARGRQPDGSIAGYPLTRIAGGHEIAAEFEGGMADQGFVYLSPTPLTDAALKIDAAKLDLSQMRLTGQVEGYAVYRGNIPVEAIVDSETTTPGQQMLDVSAPPGATTVWPAPNNLHIVKTAYPSGMNRPGDFDAAMAAESTIGVELSELSVNMLQKVADAANRGTPIFVDSGAFSAHRRGKRIDMKATMDKYVALMRMLDDTGMDNISIVAPDIVGEPGLTLGMIGSASKLLSEIGHAGVNIIYPVQTSEGMSATYFVDRLTEILLNATPNQGLPPMTLGIPSNAKAMPDAQFRAMLEKYRPSQIHILGAADRANVEARLRAIDEVLADSEVTITLDANVLRSTIANQAGIESRQQAIEDMLRNKQPERTEVVAGNYDKKWHPALWYDVASTEYSPSTEWDERLQQYARAMNQLGGQISGILGSKANPLAKRATKDRFAAWLQTVPFLSGKSFVPRTNSLYKHLRAEFEKVRVALRQRHHFYGSEPKDREIQINAMLNRRLAGELGKLVDEIGSLAMLAAAPTSAEYIAEELADPVSTPDPWPVEELPRDKPISEVLFEQDERVVVNSGELAGRHGRVVKIETVTWAGYLGSNKQTNTSYVVETDAGAIETYHPADLTREEGEPPAVEKRDVLFDGRYITPEHMQHMINMRRRDRDQAQGKLDRARTPASKAKHDEARILAESELQQAEDALNKWKFQPAPPRTVTVGQTTVEVRPNKIVTEEKADEALQKLLSKRGQLNSGYDPELAIAGATRALYHIERGAHTFAALVRAMVGEVGRWIIPYLKQWYIAIQMDPQNADIRDFMNTPQEVLAADIEEILSGEQNEVSPERVPAGDRTDAAAQDELGAPSVPDAGGRQSGVSVEGGEGTAGEGVRPGVRTGVPDVRAPARGERGDQPVSGGEREPAPARVPTRSDVGERGADDGQSGLFTDEAADLTTEEDDDALARRIDLDVKKELQRKAESIPVTLGDADNIADTLPVLFPTQHEDVLFGERRLAGETNYGVLFANGTGTGKTFVGAAMVKRMVKAGKAKNVIIVVPDQEVADGWIKAGALINLPINKLAGISDPGKGVSITTYANFGQNNAIVGQHFDVIVSDESHNLMKGKQGEETEWLRRVRALALHPKGVETRVQMQNPELWGRILKLEEQINAKGGMTGPEGRERLAELQRLRGQFRQLVDQERPYVTSMQGEKRPRAIFLSATPFAYERNVQWADGFLLDFPTSGPNVEEVGPFGAYAIENFGWRVRYGKLTEPGPAVDRSIMQREWNMRLRRSGAMSVRMLDVESDYERKFVLLESKIGRAIDEGLEWLRSAENGKFRPIYNMVTSEQRFGSLARRRLLESLKAKEAIPYIKKQHALGRKVVVFYDYTEGGGFNIFDIRTPTATRPTDNQSAASMHDLITEYRQKRPDLVALDTTGESPLVTLLREFPGAAQYNGVISKTRRKRELENFNADSMPEANLILANKASNAGWSAHDVTGAHQRVLINLGLPTAPVEAIQQEGRIYRVGQATDAIFRYFNTGTNWERSAFATTIAYRASTAENLAMGEQARGLRDSFVEAFEAAEFEEPSAADGKGSKARDRELTTAITPFDRAKTYFFGQRRKTQRDKSAEGTDYFATPEPLGFKMVEWADVRPGETALEPSAGHGAIARWFPDRIAKTAIEPSLALSSRLALAVDTGTTRIVNERFEDHNIVNKYDVIAMSPPYGTGGKTAMEHIIKAAGHLKDHGRIVAIVPDGPAMQKRLNDWLYGEAKKPVKPLADTPVGPVYKGDTVTTSVSWIPKGVVTRRETSGFLYVRTKPGEESAVQSQYITGIEPTGKRVEMVRPGEGIHQVAEILLPSVTFTNAATTVNTKVIVLDKLPEDASPPQPISRDLREATTFTQLFDALERVTVPDRVKERKDEVETPEHPQAKPTKKPPRQPVTLKTREMQHTRDKTTIYYASHEPHKLPNDHYKALASLAKKYRGYWHSAGRFNPEPGWRFDSAEDRQAFMDEAMGKEAPQAARREPEHGKVKGDVPQEITSAATSRKQVAAAIKKIEWEPGTINADIGAGKFPDTTKALAAEGVRNIPYDPFNRTEDENFDAILEIANGRRRADTATVLNVLNVIQEPDARDNVIRRAAKAIKDDGVTYFQVYEGDGSGKPGPTRDGWQENRKAESYMREIERHFDNVIRRGQVIEARDPIRGPLSDKWHDGTDLVFARERPSTLKPTAILKVQPVGWAERNPSRRMVTVYRNPSPAKLLNKLRINVRIGMPPFEYRWARSKEGDVYVWDAVEATHFDMSKGIERAGEATFAQPGYLTGWSEADWGFIELDGRRLIASDSHGNNDVDIGTILPEAAAAARRTGFERTASYDGQAAMEAARKLDAWATQVTKHLESRKAAAKAARIEIVRSLDELRQILDETAETVRSGTKGVYIREGNRIYLVAEELETLEEADRIFTHEAIGHMAMERYAVMADAVKAAIQLRDTDETIRNLWAQVRVDEHDKTEYQQAKEVVARLAEGTIEHPLIDRMVAALKRLIRSWGIKLDFSKRELRGMIASAARQQLREKPSPYESKAERASRKEYELLANRREPGTPQEARNVTAQAMRRGAPLDTLMRLPFQMLGLLNEHGEFTLGAKASRKLEHYLKNAKFDQGSGPVSEAVNLILEKARWGLLDRYGVPESAVQAGNKAESEKRNIQHQGMVLLRKILTTVSDPLESKILQEMLTGETLDDARFSQLRDEIRAAIEALSLDALNLGLISRESYERNKGSYLHRVYLETEKQRGGRRGLSEWMATMLHGRRARIQGNELKGRGMFWEVTQERLLRDIDKEDMDLPGGVKMAPGKADPQFIGHKFRVLDLVKTPGEGVASLEGFEAGAQPAKLVNRVWWPKDFPVPAKYADYADRGVFEIRDVVGNKFIMWRDFTKEERNQMGEILDVRYTLARMYQLFAQDISSAKYFRELSRDPNVTWQEEGPPPKALLAKVRGNDPLKPMPTRDVMSLIGYEWIQVPKTTIAETGGVPKWGDLAGKYIRVEVWKDLNEYDRMNERGPWVRLLEQWKLNKTARNPVVHMNNMISNLLLADMVDVTIRDLIEGFQLYMENGGQGEARQRAERYGAFGYGYADQELNKHLRDTLATMVAENRAGLYEGFAGRLKFFDRFGSIVSEGLALVSKADDKMVDAYAAEDDVFRMATFVKYERMGFSPDEAAQMARDEFMNYNIRAPWINSARRSVLPFLAYSYRAIPVIANAIMRRPWKLAKYALLAEMANVLAYALSEGDEDWERRTMAKRDQGRSWMGGAPYMMRLPFNDQHGNPMFIDIRRWIPGGDVFDLNQEGVIPVPAWLHFGGPLVIAAEIVLNRSAFTGEDIVDPLTDDTGDAAKAYAGHLWKSAAPSAPWIPGSWYWDKIGRSIGGLDAMGRELSTPQALASAVGVKARSHDPIMQVRATRFDYEKKVRALRAELRVAARQQSQRLISESEYKAIERDITDKLALANEDFVKRVQE